MDEVPYSFEGYEYLVEPVDLITEKFIVRKGAQLGWTEAIGINRVLYGIVVRRASALYLLPTGDDVSDFSAARMNPAIEDSPLLSQLFTQINNVGLKRAGSISLYLRGTNSRTKLKSIPVGELYLDEYDEMDPANVTLAKERLSGHKVKYEVNFSTPTIPEYGIDKEWRNSDQRMYVVECPFCKRKQYLDWPGNVVWDESDSSTASFCCQDCKHLWTYDDRAIAIKLGKWVVTNPNGSYPGYWINQLCSRTLTAVEIVRKFITSEENDIKKKEWFNSVLGMPYVPKGGLLSLVEIRNVTTGPCMLNASAGCTMGVDVGAYYYYEIARWNGGRQKEVVRVGRVKNTEELYPLMHNYAIWRCVMDANPERREARRFADHFRGRVFLAFYPTAKEELKKKVAEWDEANNIVSIARTESLDITLGRFRRQGEIILPRDIPDEYVQHLRNVVRTLEEEERDGQPTGRVFSKYLETGPDHYVHASNYNDVAGNNQMSGYTLLKGVSAKEHVNQGSGSLFSVDRHEERPTDFSDIESRWGPA